MGSKKNRSKTVKKVNPKDEGSKIAAQKKADFLRRKYSVQPV